MSTHAPRYEAPARTRREDIHPGVISKIGSFIGRHPYASTMATVGLYLGASQAVEKIEHNRHPYGIIGEADQSKQVSAFKKISTVAPIQLVLREGAQLRFTPETVKGNDAHKSNVAATVPAGKEFLVQLPAHAKGSNWMAVKLPGTHGPLTAENTRYVNVGALEGQVSDDTGLTYAEEFPRTDITSPMEFVATSSSYVATTEMLDAGTIEGAAAVTNTLVK